MNQYGYKQTEIGVIPEDWDVLSFDKCFRILSNNTLSRAELNEAVGTIKNIHYGDILVKYNNLLNCANEAIPYIRNPNMKSSLMFLVNGDLIIADTAEDETVGKAIEITNIGEHKIVSGLHTIPCRPISPEMFANGWLGYYINHGTYHDQLKPFITGTKVSAISKSSISGTLILVPPVEEQKRIAEALSDVDNMISSLEKLIAKKKAVKQGAMQELLTGKKRLPGFTGEWETYKLDEIAKIIMGQSPDSKFYNDSNGMPLIQGNADISNRKTWVRFYTTQITKKAFAGDIIFTVRAPVGNVAKTSFDCCVGRGVCALRDANDFLFHYLVYIEPYWATLSAGSTFDSINSDTLANTELLIPSDVEEQTAIASILSDMDNEIEALEQKLEKTRQVKQGMMQQLLTGKIRLIDDATNASAPDDSGKILTPKTQTNHNHQFDDAVMIAAVVNSFYSPKYRLGRKKVQKLLYLLRRKQEADTSAFKKKAAGPYADEVRYKGGEPIAKHNGYIETKKNNKGTLFSIGPKMASALEYIAKWQMQDSLDWLVKTFKYIGVEELELLATVDMAMCDLVHAGIEVSVDSIKQLIRSNEEWKAKLKKVTFSDDAIARAIEKCRELFGY